MKLLRYKLYSRQREDLWFNLLLNQKLASASKLAELLYKKRLYLKKKELILSLLPPSVLKERSKFPSRYKKQLLEKQRLQLFYSVLKDYKIKNYLDKALRSRGRLEENLLILLETRLSTLLVRAGFANTSLQARQFIGHFGVEVAGRTTNRYNQQVGVGDLVSVDIDPTPTPLPFGYPSTYLELSHTTSSFILHKLPTVEEIPLPFDLNLSDVVSFYF